MHITYHSSFNNFLRLRKLYLSTIGADALGFLAVLCVLFYGLTWISPSFMGGQMRLLSSTSAIVVSLLLFLKNRVNFRHAAPFLTGACLIQLWSIFTNVVSSYNTGRPINTERSALYLVEYALPFFVVYFLHFHNQRLSGLVLRILFSFFLISCFVGYLQFFRIPPFFQIANYYTYKAIDNWGGVGGVRAVGLCWHPNEFVLHGMFCFGVSLYFIVRNKPNFWRLFGLFFSSGAVIISGSRSGILAFFVFLFILSPYLYRLQPKLFLACVYVGAFLLLSAILLAPNKFNYYTQSLSLSQDASYRTRTDSRWDQAYEINSLFPLTGIGPDQSLTFGLGAFDKFVPRGETMESMYLLYLACHGYIGLTLLIVFLVAYVFFLSKNIYFLPGNDSKHYFSLVSLPVAVYIAVTGYAMNTVDHFTVLPLFFTTSALVFLPSPTTVEKTKWSDH